MSQHIWMSHVTPIHMCVWLSHVTTHMNQQCHTYSYETLCDMAHSYVLCHGSFICVVPWLIHMCCAMAHSYETLCDMAHSYVLCHGSFICVVPWLIHVLCHGSFICDTVWHGSFICVVTWNTPHMKKCIHMCDMAHISGSHHTHLWTSHVAIWDGIPMWMSHVTMWDTHISGSRHTHIWTHTYKLVPSQPIWMSHVPCTHMRDLYIRGGFD